MSSQQIFESIKTAVKNGQAKINIHGTHGLAKAHVAATLSTIRPVVFITENHEQSENLLADLRFLLNNEQDSVLYLPAYELTPFHAASPDPNIMKERLATLHKIAIGHKAFRVLVAPLEALAVKTVPLISLQAMTEMLEKDAEIDRENLIQRLELSGYSRVNTVEDKGTYAVRGSVIDVFWPGSPRPCRIDLFGDTIESLKLFDPETQRTILNLNDFTLGPCKETFLSDEAIALAKERLQDLADEVLYPTKKLKEKLADLNNKVPFFGIERLLKAFHPQLETPLEILQKIFVQDPSSTRTRGSRPDADTLDSRFRGNDIIYICDDLTSIPSNLASIADNFATHYESSIKRGDLSYAPVDYLASTDDFIRQLENGTQISFSGLEQSSFELPCQETSGIRQQILLEATRTTPNESPHELLTPLATRIRSLKQDGMQVMLPAASFGSTKRVQELLMPLGINVQLLKDPPNFLELDTNGSWPKLNPGVHAYTFIAKPAPPANGAIFPHLSFAVFAEDEIFGKRARRDGQQGKKGRFRTNLSDLEEGDHIVHVDHGVGIFRGLTKLNVRGIEQDYILLTYAGEDKLYLPVHRINLIQTYSEAEGKSPKLDKLGGISWQSKKTKVKEAVLSMAQDLLNLYAKRELAKRPKFATPDTHYWEFEARFPFETTIDQQKAIDDVLADMQRDRPMDRLICGDVGYGKTEVAMRAAMLSVESGCQVGVLAPTTILAQQHGLTFAERFKESGVSVEIISRFQKPKEISETLQKLKEGKVDILVGTHRLLSSDVSFKNLGLIIVDEEQRFGIKAKEHLKNIKSRVDVLTLSATPIPRTLQMGFFGVRDLSVIETPPVDRRAIRTSVIQFDDEVIRETILRELSRGGQVYFVHNRVTSIAAKADHLKRLVPEAKIKIGHGQMEAEALEDVMVGFMKHEFNVLVCTTIIETGIDVPKANTMFIDDADDFGLAQLYQLRGRIGRSNERAFAYLIVPSAIEHLTPIARKRLEILNRFSELGAGFHIAQHDLELRGAGDLLGRSQHGHVAAVGYDLYAELLKDAVEELRGQTQTDVPDPDINLPIKAFIPDSYVSDLHERMGFYQKLASTSQTEAIWDVIGTMADQYGEAPPEVLALGQLMILKQELRLMRARGLEIGSAKEGTDIPRLILSLGNEAALNTAKLMNWIKAMPERVSLTPKMKLIYSPTKDEWETMAIKDISSLCTMALKDIKDRTL